MRTCIFCGGAANSREHVIAQRIIDRMQLRQYPVRQGHRLGNVLNLRPEPHGLAALTARVVCRECNHGWMNDLESWFDRTAGCLIEPRWPILATTMIENLQAEAEFLARWCLKTGIMIDRSGVKPMIPGSVASDLFAGKLPDRLRVDLARIKTGRLGSHTLPGFWTRNGDQPVEFQSRQDGLAFQSIIQLNHLGLRVFSAPDARAAYIKPDQMVVRIYPPLKFSNVFEYESLEDFGDNLLIVAGK